MENLPESLKWVLIGIQVVISPLMIGSVLLQAGKGDDIQSALGGGGGGGSSVMGSGGASRVLVRATVVLSILFMLNSIALAKVFKASATSITNTMSEPVAPAVPLPTPGAAPAPEAGKPTETPATAPAN